MLIIMAQSKTKIPIAIEEKIVVRSRQNDTIKVSCRVLGAWHGKFLIIEDPVFRVNERLSIPIEGDVLCWYLFGGDVYQFMSKVLGSYSEGFALLEYPDAVQIDKLRRYPRIPMKLQTQIQVENSRGSLRSTMNDISTGGCSLTINSLEVIAKNTACKLSFTLPDGQKVSGLEAAACTCRTHVLKKTTAVGLKFLGPVDQIEIISSFCRSFEYLKLN